LYNIHTLGGAREVLLVGDGQEVLQLFKVHGGGPSLLSIYLLICLISSEHIVGQINLRAKYVWRRSIFRGERIRQAVSASNATGADVTMR
jgi:hypothetical protein